MIRSLRRTTLSTDTLAGAAAIVRIFFSGSTFFLPPPLLPEVPHAEYTISTTDVRTQTNTYAHTRPPNNTRTHTNNPTPSTFLTDLWNETVKRMPFVQLLLPIYCSGYVGCQPSFLCDINAPTSERNLLPLYGHCILYRFSVPPTENGSISTRQAVSIRP